MSDEQANPRQEEEAGKPARPSATKYVAEDSDLLSTIEQATAKVRTVPAADHAAAGVTSQPGPFRESNSLGGGFGSAPLPTAPGLSGLAGMAGMANREPSAADDQTVGSDQAQAVRLPAAAKTLSLEEAQLRQLTDLEVALGELTDPGSFREVTNLSEVESLKNIIGGLPASSSKSVLASLESALATAKDGGGGAGKLGSGGQSAGAKADLALSLDPEASLHSEASSLQVSKIENASGSNQTQWTWTNGFSSGFVSHQEHASGGTSTYVKTTSVTSFDDGTVEFQTVSYWESTDKEGNTTQSSSHPKTTTTTTYHPDGTKTTTTEVTHADGTTSTDTKTTNEEARSKEATDAEDEDEEGGEDEEPNPDAEQPMDPRLAGFVASVGGDGSDPIRHNELKDPVDPELEQAGSPTLDDIRPDTGDIDPDPELEGVVVSEPGSFREPKPIDPVDPLGLEAVDLGGKPAGADGGDVDPAEMSASDGRSDVPASSGEVGMYYPWIATGPAAIERPATGIDSATDAPTGPALSNEATFAARGGDDADMDDLEIQRLSAISGRAESADDAALAPVPPTAEALAPGGEPGDPGMLPDDQPPG